MSDRIAAALSDRYMLERELGQGGMAIVYLAQSRREERLGKPVRRVPRGLWPAWSPDGKRLVYASERGGGSLRVVAVDSGAP